MYSQQDFFYKHNIFIEELQDPGFRLSLADLQKSLNQVASQSFLVNNFKGSREESGVYLLLNKPNILPAAESAKLAKGSIEDFYMKGDTKRLFIVANHPIGLSRGIYSYLDKLGFKWYFPGDDWEYIPKIKESILIIDKYFSPSFELRDFFGTGGLFRVMSIDKDEMVKKNWNDWKRRNRMGGAVELSGHYWEVFNIANKTELQKHPEYLAEIKGKRVVYKPDSKLCISNKELQTLFVNDRIKYLQQQLEQRKWDSEKILLAVDPSDGGGHCECENCKKMGSVSDRVFSLANLVAKAARSVSKRAYVNLYAYNEHAAPPAINLESNVLVQIIPYAFQNIGTPVEMINRWKQKTSNLFIYDYYGLADWHSDLPLTGRWSNAELIKKLKYWKEIKLNGFLLESSYSIGSAGMGLYLMSRIGWDISESTDKITQEYYTKMFGAGGETVKKYYEDINNNFKGVADIPFLYATLSKAEELEKQNPEVKDRLLKLQAYIHYTVLYYQWKAAKGDQIVKALEKLMEYIWEIYPAMMVHSTRIAQLYYTGLSENKLLMDKWNINDKSAKGILNVKWIVNTEIEKKISQDKTEYKLLEDFDYSNSPVVYNFFIKRVSSAEENKEMLFLGFPDALIKTSATGSFHFLIKVNETSANNLSQDIVIQCVDAAADGKIVFERKMKINKNWQEVIINALPGKPYRLLVKNTNWFKIAIKNSAWVAFRNIPTYSSVGKLWFYIPMGKKYYYFKNTTGQIPAFFDPDGIKINPRKVNEEGIYQLPVSKSNAWWSIDKVDLQFLEFYTKPVLFFTHPGYLVISERVN